MEEACTDALEEAFGVHIFVAVPLRELLLLFLLLLVHPLSASVSLVLALAMNRSLLRSSSYIIYVNKICV